METVNHKKVGIVSLIGPANAGKSTLLNTIIGKKVSIVSPKVQTTRQRVLGIRTDKNSQIILVDSPGFFSRKYRGEMSKFLKNEIAQSSKDVDIILFVVDVTKLNNNENIKIFLNQLKNHPGLSSSGSTPPVLFVLNKIDLLERKKILPLIDNLKNELNNFFEGKLEADFIPISAQKNDGIDLLCGTIISHLEEGPLLFPEDVCMELSDEQFAAELIREKAFNFINQELPYSLSVVCRGWEESKNLHTIFADIIVEKDTHKMIVIGKSGQMLKRIGSSARNELERIYGVKILLKLFVRVESNWTRSVPGLLKAGYTYSEDRS